MPPPIPLRLGLVLLTAVVLGGPLVPAHAQLKPSATAHAAPAASTADLPPTLSALRSQLFAPAERAPRPNADDREDRWLARDKARHVVFSGLWTLSTQYVLVRKVGWRERAALPLSVGTAATVGGLKELYDATRPQRTASGKDLVANAVGIGLATGLILW